MSTDVGAAEETEARELVHFVTQQTRFTLLNDILQHPDQLPSMYELEQLNPSISDATVYKHIQKLIDAGIVEEDDILDGVDRTPQRVTIEMLSNVADSVLVRPRNVVGILIDAVSIAEQNQSRLLKLEPEVRSIDLLEEPQVALFEDASRGIGDAWDRREFLHL